MVQCGNHSMVESVVTQKLYSHLVCCISPWWNPMGEIRWLHPTVKTGVKRKRVFWDSRNLRSNLRNTLIFQYLDPSQLEQFSEVWLQFSDGKIHGKITMVQSPCAWQTATHLLLVKSERQCDSTWPWPGPIPAEVGFYISCKPMIIHFNVNNIPSICLDNLDIFISM
jgi:hypothetical protein